MNFWIFPLVWPPLQMTHLFCPKDIVNVLGFAVVIAAAADPFVSSEFECLAWKGMGSESLELQSNYISYQTVSYLQS